jgi:N-acetylmuramoyl-L-alanine amidase/putative methionine-R-sulfoxide reductase with GAF domain
MATTPTKPTTATDAGPVAAMPSWPRELGTSGPPPSVPGRSALNQFGEAESQPGRHHALQALLAFSALHQQIRRRRALAAGLQSFDGVAPGANLANPKSQAPEFEAPEFEAEEQFVLDEVLQLVAERSIAITGADGLGIALAENNEIVLRASAGIIKPDVGARIQRDSAFSGACFRTAQIICCDDTEKDDRVNLYACRQLGARSMVAVPLCGRRRVIGLLEAFSAEPFGFNDSDVASLQLLAELILGALRPEDEDRFAESAQQAEMELYASPVNEPACGPVAKVPSEDSFEIAAEAQAVEVEPELAPALVELTALEPPSVAEATGAPYTSLDETIAIEAEPAPPSTASATNHHPGILVVLGAAVVFALVAAALWWWLSNVELGQKMLRPEPRIAKPAAVSKPPAPMVAPAAGSNAGATVNGTNIGASATPINPAVDVDGPAPHTTASPQEVAKMPRITSVRHWSSADSSTVVLDLEDQVQYEAHRLSNPDRIYFDLHDTGLSPDLAGKTIEIGDALLARVRVAQPASGLTRVVLETKGNSTYSVSLEPNPYRLVVQVSKPGSDPKAQVALFPGSAESARLKMPILVPPPTREDLQMRAHLPKLRIVVDAGHGGWDLGTVGRRGLLEKDVVLEIAQRLAKLLETRLGAQVILTRNDDNYIPLDERAGIANQAQADLFVSVHANYSDLTSARGVETYYTNFFSSPSAKDLETRTASPSPTTTALSPVDLHERIEQSRRLAASVQRSLYAALSGQNPGLRDRGVKEASYVVLTETAMPGVLAEVSFVSSPTDEQKLRSDGYREQIAEALYHGIARYAANSHNVKVASAAK